MNSILFEHFKRLDQASYLAKSEFYKIKEFVLLTEAVADGFDIQISEKSCTKCYGRGFKIINNCRRSRKKITYEKVECLECQGTGIIGKREWYLRRYILNGEVFHLSANTKPTTKLVNTITTPRQMQSIDPSDSYYSLALLLLYTNPYRIDEISEKQLYPPLMTTLSSRLDELVTELNLIRSHELKMKVVV